MGANNKQTTAQLTAESLQPMPEDYFNRLAKICNRQTAGSNDRDLIILLHNMAVNAGAKVEIDQAGNMIITKGSGPMPAIVAHTDTVHHYANDFKLYYHETGGRRKLYAMNGAKPHGIGGDDKCGIFIAMECIYKYDNVKAIFTVEEESGGIGANAIDMDVFKDCTFALQFDRWGRGDFITTASMTELSGKEFQKAVLPIMDKYGFRFASGFMTDVQIMKSNGLDIACANISCGYYEHHTDNEYIDCNELYNSLLFCFAVIDEHGGRKFKHTYTYKPGKAFYGDMDFSFYGRGKKSNKVEDSYLFSDKCCIECGTILTYPDEQKSGLCRYCEKIYF